MQRSAAPVNSHFIIPNWRHAWEGCSPTSTWPLPEAAVYVVPGGSSLGHAAVRNHILNLVLASPFYILTPLPFEG